MYWTDIKISWDGLCSCQEHRLFKDNRFQNKSNKSRLKCRGELRSHANTLKLLYIFYQFDVPHFSVGKPQLILTSVCKLYYRSYRKKHIRRIASFFSTLPEMNSILHNIQQNQCPWSLLFADVIWPSTWTSEYF